MGQIVGERDGGRLAVRRRRRMTNRLFWSLLAVPVGLGCAVGAWHLVGPTAGPTIRIAYVVVVFCLTAGTLGLARGRRR